MRGTRMGCLAAVAIGAAYAASPALAGPSELGCDGVFVLAGECMFRCQGPITVIGIARNISPGTFVRVTAVCDGGGGAECFSFELQGLTATCSGTGQGSGQGICAVSGLLTTSLYCFSP